MITIEDTAERPSKPPHAKAWLTGWFSTVYIIAWGETDRQALDRCVKMLLEAA